LSQIPKQVENHLSIKLEQDKQSPTIYYLRQKILQDWIKEGGFNIPENLLGTRELTMPIVQSSGNCIYVDGLSKETNESNFIQFFSRFGDTCFAFLNQQKEELESNWGYVQYLNKSSVKHVLARTLVLDNSSLKCQLAIKTRKNNNNSTTNSTKIVYFGKLPFETTEDELVQYFQENSEEIKSIELKENNDSKNTGAGSDAENKFKYAYVSVDSEKTLKKIFSRPHRIHEHNVQIREVMTREQFD